jgi:hypothetical protein
LVVVVGVVEEVEDGGMKKREEKGCYGWATCSLALGWENLFQRQQHAADIIPCYGKKRIPFWLKLP